MFEISADHILAWVIGVYIGFGVVCGCFAAWVVRRKPWEKAGKELSEINDGTLTMINEQADQLRKHMDNEVKAVTCEGCGCLVDSKTAIHGKDEIRVVGGAGGVFQAMADQLITGCYNPKKEIYTPHYCKRCAKTPTIDAGKKKAARK